MKTTSGQGKRTLDVRTRVMNTTNKGWRLEAVNGKRKLHIVNYSPLSPLLSPLTADSRRGVLLIIVLAVLAMFGMMAVALVIISGHARMSSESIMRFEQVTDPPEKLLRQAAMQVFRGPKSDLVSGMPDLASVMGAHSLLEDIYGNEYIPGVVGSAAFNALPQLIDIDVTGVTPTVLSRRIGCVLTITGPAGSPFFGMSTRIVAAVPNSTVIQVEAFPNVSTAPPAALNGNSFIINGVPFSGMGFGYDSGNYNQDLTLDTTTTPWQLSSIPASTTHWPVALLPNLPLSTYVASGYDFGGANEDYDAADFQNMLLAAQVPSPASPGQVHTLPSLHRPALVRYWMKIMNPGLTTFTQADWRQFALNNPELARKISLRPIGDFPDSDHPNFTGSNPNFNPAWDMITAGEGRWDVDNDGDGEPDSVWVDLGMPVRQTSDGRLYKPLFAILCVDLDGRVNLNAHGSIPQTDTANYNTMVSLGAINGPVLTRGQGIGPADVNPYYLIGDVYSRNIMQGIAGSYQGRYGNDAGLGSAMPGSATLDALNANKWFNYGGDSLGVNNYGAAYWDFTHVNHAGSYGSPPDVFGVGAVGLDIAGRPVYAGMLFEGATPLGYGSGAANSPYELNLDANQHYGRPSYLATVDNPFSLSELERVLRPFDRDAPALPDRLAQLTAATPGVPHTSILHGLRHSITTASYDLPCPNVVTPPSMSDTDRSKIIPDRRVKHITDLLRARGVPETAFAELLPPDLLAGLRMNVNRPFGNGLDDDGNGVVDDPSETTTQAVVLNGSSISPFSFDGTDGIASGVTTSLAARQREARFLYVLACLTVDLEAFNTRFGNYAETARFLAQWAVNVVDFKDRDSIMTPFDYDPDFANPSSTISGWSTTPGISPRVWGCERPELLISETLAFHDRRSEDLDTEQVDNTEGDNQTDPETVPPATPDPNVHYDVSFDQRFKPQGSLFIELYNPWSEMEPRSGDLYTAPDGGVDLTKVDPSGNSPVWRMIIVDQFDADKDPDDPDPTNHPNIEKAIYFVGPSAVSAFPTEGTVQFFPDNNHAARIAPIYPGRYAVIGPGKQADTTSITYLGFDNGENPGNVQTSPNTTRRIELNPNANPNTGDQVRIYHNGTSDDLNSLAIKNPTSIVVTMPDNQRLSISEPDGGYVDVGPGGAAYDPTNGFVPAWDIPLDKNSPVSPNVKAAIMNNGRLDNLKVVHLQRLANPLLPYNNTPTDPNYNPYRTIDSMSIDLAAFNGIETTTDPQVNTSTNNRQFYSRQRGQHNSPAGTMNLWTKEPFVNSPIANLNRLPVDLSGRTFNLKEWPLHHSLGYLNDPYGLPIVHPTTGERGLPSSPFPWLAWLNRPYVSQYEIMQAPWLSSSRLLDWYNMEQGSNPYTDFGMSASFPHLTNYFLSRATSSSPQDEELHRVFEYLGVPSPFVGAETQADPAAANSVGHTFRPPFNNISTYREPGRINLNTIYSQGVFNALKNGSLANVTWSDFVLSRRGYGAAVPPVVLRPDNRAQFPTEFGKPFRSFGGAAMVPTLPGDVLKYDKEIDATLLRERGTTGRPLFQAATTSDADNVDRNPFFRYQGIQRLGNLVTTRSNVYAVWITVGYFEVEPAAQTHPSMPPADRQMLFPDGYTLGRELGMDTGEIERHRAFYIFDRSIPVAFQRGQDLNVDKAILVDRFIE